MSAQPYIPEDARDWLALFSIAGIGPGRFMQLVSAFGSPASALQAGPDEWNALPGFGDNAVAALRKGPDERFVEAQLTALEKAGASMAVIGGKGYSPLLARIAHPPPFIFYQGDPVFEDEAAIAVVGARVPSPYGRKMARQIADGLARAGVTVVSGLALGVDGLSHEAALAAAGRTIGILGSGLDVMYPREHADLARQVTQHGAVISEFPFGAPPARENFPKRNRIISGLAQGTVIIEARKISGALSTARHALEQNRDVYAVPGPAGSALSEGTNNLIKAGAQLITSADDILADLQLATRPKRERRSQPALSPLQETVCRHLGETPCHIDQLALDSGLTIGELSSVLLDLELMGVVGQEAGKRFYRV